MLPEAEKAKFASYLTPLPDSGQGELLAWAPTTPVHSVSGRRPVALPPSGWARLPGAEPVHSEGELDRILQEQLARLRSSWSHESSWHGSR